MTCRIASSAVLLVFATMGRSDDAAKIEHFEAKIRPILVEHCIQCHGPKKQKGGLRLDLREAAMAGGESGKTIVPGKTHEGELLKAVRYEPEGYRMPPSGKLPDAVVAELERWIKDGAHWPAESSKQTAKAENSNDWFDQRRREHWCWQPVKRTPAPSVKDPSWSFGDIDGFLLKSMEREGLMPFKDADRFTLLRRLHFLLTGLPPTQEEIETFSIDTDETAFERTVDRLLASPAFGERWSRHWLDLVRFSETLGHEFDFDIPNAWRYRDYVIRALNDDLPYDRFVVEHVAGDLVPQQRLDAKRQTNESVVGTAFWWLGEAKQAPVDVKAEQADHVDNQIDVMSKTFLGLTVSCARCHDHKFDAISAADYYSLYGFLKSTRYSQASTIPVGRWREEIATRSRLEQETRTVVADRWKAMIAEFADPSKAASILRAAEAPEVVSEPNPKSRSLGDASAGLTGWRRSGPAAMLAEAQVGDPMLTVDPAAPIATLHESPAFDTSRWSSRLQGSLRSPTFVIDRPFLNVFASGMGTRFNVVVDNFNVIRAPIYGGLRAKLDSPAAKWRTIDVKSWMGHEAYIEFLDQTVADLGDPDQREYPADAWFAVEKVLLADAPQSNDSRPQQSSKKPATVVEWESEQQTEGPLSRLKRRATDAVAAWRSGSPMAPKDARLLNRIIEAGLFRFDMPMLKLAELDNERRRLDERLPDYAAAPAAEDGDGRDESVFIRGNTKKLGPSSPRRFLAAIDDRVVRDDGSGRLALAKKIVDPKNPLTARVVVNRVWRHVIGRGLVE
jgi:cytochrome c553/mono/diheme cytochrome c family protein